VYPKVIASFLQDTTFGKTPLTVHFINESINAPSVIWNFGDSITSKELNPTHVFINNEQTAKNYNVQLIASNNCGAKDSSFIEVTVLPNCNSIAKFEADKTEGTSPLTVNFTNTSINSSFYLWHFCDSIFSTNTNPSFNFYNYDTTVVEYIVTLKAADYNCGLDSASMIIKVYPMSNMESSIAMGNSVLKSSELKLYPNPTKDKIKIQYNLQKSSDVVMELMDPSGRILSKTTELKKPLGVNITIIDLSEYKGNLFYLKVTMNEKNAVYKVVKN
jgi:PKD repeat protein